MPPTFTLTFSGSIPDVALNRTEFAQAIANGISVAIQNGAGFLSGVEGGPMPTTDQGIWHPTGSSTIELYSPAAGKYLPLATVPTGLVSPYGGPNAPDGWLLCDGTAVAQASYPQLFTVIGYNYAMFGADSTKTADTTQLTAASQFRLPDLRGRFPLGAGSGVPNSAGGTNTLTPRALGDKLGQENVTLKQAELPDPIILQAAEYDSTGNQATKALYGGIHYTSQLYNVNSPNPTAASSTVTNMPPFDVLSYIIKT